MPIRSAFPQTPHPVLLKIKEKLRNTISRNNVFLSLSLVIHHQAGFLSPTRLQEYRLMPSNKALPRTSQQGFC